MLIGRVVDDQVEKKSDASLTRLLRELDEVAESSESGIDGVVVGNVVSVVAVRRGVDRIQPQNRDAESGQVVQAADETAQVTVAIAIGVLKASTSTQ